MNKILVLMLLVSTSIFALSTPVSVVPTDSTEYLQNRQMGNAALKTTMGSQIRQAHTTAVGVWDISKQGGAVGNYAVGITLPNKAIIRNVFTDEASDVTTSAGGSLDFIVVPAGSVHTELTNDRAAAGWTGRQAGRQDGTVTNMVKPAAASSVLVRLKSGAMTAGKVKIFIDYVVSE